MYAHTRTSDTRQTPTSLCYAKRDSLLALLNSNRALVYVSANKTSIHISDTHTHTILAFPLVLSMARLPISVHSIQFGALECRNAEPRNEMGQNGRQTDIDAWARGHDAADVGRNEC